MNRLEDYREIIGNEAFVDIHRRARQLYGKHFVHINSTYSGGGVAEMLRTLVPMLNNVGMETGWRVLAGSSDFFGVTKRLHNGLQGETLRISQPEKAAWLAENEGFSVYNHIHHDCVVVHDPQPLPLARSYPRKQPWVWRCHLDLSQPNAEVWDLVSEYATSYDAMIVSSELYTRPDLPIEQRVFAPAIDPLSPKNAHLTQHQIDEALARFGVPTDKPLVVQVSRFDKWKDPLGVVAAFLMVKEEMDCRLVLCGGAASDDPEGLAVFRDLERAARPHIVSGDIILVNYESNIFINALQRSAAVVVQKSSREGFGLTITEALWKARPVVATAVGGIPLQITDRQTGLLCKPNDDRAFADCILRILRDPEWGRELGEAGHQRVQERFLITRLLGDYIDLFADLTC